MVALRSLRLVLPCAWLAIACNKETPPAAEEPRSAEDASGSPTTAAALKPAEGVTPAAAVTEAAGATTTAASKVSDPSFELTLQPKAGLKAGQAGNVEIVLVAKAPFHVNEKYPIKLKLKETPGLKYESLTLGKDAVKLETQRATLPIGLTPERAGKFTVAGQFAFSVCTDDKCLMEKRDLALDVSVD